MHKWVYFFNNRAKDFNAKCNKESVAIESVVDAEDLNWLQEILKEFVDKTGSKIAEEILHDWPAATKDFVKVDYVILSSLCIWILITLLPITMYLFSMVIDFPSRISKSSEGYGW